ncbi:hypothetical protein IWW39_001706 [Coemansia spiralis]|uniref:3-oxo-5-alpha-steroid 4-dehydrogenase C-terminal domain-containing protein n=1 Tax=Coemansia spiralis TaxID=417178 RepID=A0A9W8L601_9FUNG|nr:hypothetical protein IWW39_001706 [Coemansia spiralis]
MSFAFVLCLIYAALAGIALVFALAPSTREVFVKYGRTRDKPETAAKGTQTSGARAGRSTILAAALHLCASWTVPKNLFTQFYCVGAIISGLLTIDTIAWCNSQATPELSGADQRFFGHRYLLFEQWLFGGSSQSRVPIADPSRLAVLSLVLFTIHVLIRLKECVYDQPLTDARMHIGQYAVGIVFYVVTPLAVVADSYYPPGWGLQSSWTVPVGIAIFIYASIHQWRCHQILYGLRRRGLDAKSTGPDSTSTSQGSSARLDSYAIPTGDLFKYVSCPHFLCEILIYISIWLASACQATTLLWVIGWTAINLGITARESQQWYRARFGARYPRDRRALVPFVW